MPEHDVKIVPGDASKDRFFAASFDNAIAMALGLAAAMAFPSDQLVQRGAAIVAAYLAYFLVFESLFGSSPGKMLFGLWVRRLEGGRCSWQQAAIRTAARLVEVNPLLVGALPAALAIFISGNRQRIGDIIAGTVVRRGRGD